MIQLHGVSKTWDNGETWAVDSLDLKIPQGEVCALLGGSGCGKSTTIKMINRLIEPSKGEIEIGGTNVLELDPTTLRRQVGYVFQGVGLFPHMSVAENVSVVPRLCGLPKDQWLPRIEELLQMVELPLTEFGDRYPAQLSGGQKQRVGFARALAMRPDVMLLDEPFGALDPVTRDSLQSEFSQLQRDLGFTALLVTHDMAEALLLADQIAVMQEGKVIRRGTPAELLREPGSDYVSALLETPRRHGRLIHSLETAAGDTTEPPGVDT